MSSRTTLLLQTAGLLVACLALGAPARKAISWKPLQAGVELATIPSGRAEGPLYVVRIDPARARLAVGLASQTGGGSKTAAEWCRTSRFAVATNLGMFSTDQLTHTGYLRSEKHLNNAKWNDYRAVLAVGPRQSSLAPAIWVDLDKPSPARELEQYEIVVQNLRLIAGHRRNVWAENGKRWSEAALAIDSKGRLLFVFSRAPYSMREFNTLLMSLPLDVDRAMHLEGGPEASLSIHVPGLDLDLCGSYETGFWHNDSNKQQWAIPNVIGVVRADAAAQRP
ncbi:MAG TPA: phosphodiester glycosidase family protein [Thermoanaerobaculia bacterium]|nr:phosphodiester glycosidase family protein [Thermoanaerobaculia bacterium]